MDGAEPRAGRAVSEDKSQKTEKPTARRKSEAKRKGQVPKSQEIGTAASLLVALVALRAFGSGSAETILGRAQIILGNAGHSPDLGAIASLAGSMLVAGTAPVLGLAMAVGLAAGVAQVGFVISPEAAKPKLSNLSPKRGLERLKPAVAGWELVRTMLKLGLFAAVVYQPVAESIRSLAGVRHVDRAMADVAFTIWDVLLRGAMLALLIGISDYLFQRWRNTKGLKMSKEEIKQEYKNSDGDPMIKGQRRRRAHEMSRNRLLNVVTADVVVTNPTHFAVALAYTPPEPAPRVVAKGTDHLARRMRKLAARHGVPVIENRPLARSLYRRSKVGSFVPNALYEATAIVLAESYRRRGRRRAA
jgi:flagellar biosynthesis protein FlhB